MLSVLNLIWLTFCVRLNHIKTTLLSLWILGSKSFVCSSTAPIIFFTVLVVVKHRVYTQIHKITLPMQSLGCPAGWMSLVVSRSGQNFQSMTKLWCAVLDRSRALCPQRQPSSIFIYPGRNLINVGLRGVNCPTWERQLIVWRQRQTMLQLWECGNGLCMWCVRCWERERGRIYPCEHTCRLSSASRSTFQHLQIFLASRYNRHIFIIHLDPLCIFQRTVRQWKFGF